MAANLDKPTRDPLVPIGIKVKLSTRDWLREMANNHRPQLNLSQYANFLFETVKEAMEQAKLGKKGGGGNRTRSPLSALLSEVA
jgi:hypothetical protein